MKKLISLFVAIALLVAIIAVPACKGKTVVTTTTTIEDVVDDVTSDDATTDAQ